MMGALSITHILVVILVVLVLFGRNKISSTMGDIGRSFKEFRKGMKELE